MTGKTDKRFMFQVQLDWQGGLEGALKAPGIDNIVQVGTPKEFGGSGDYWSPEHLFLSSISSCFMTTFLAFAKKLNFSIAGFSCNTIGQVEIVEGKYKFTRLDVYPKIYIAEESLRKPASDAILKTHKYCLIANSVNAEIFYHSEVLIAPVELKVP